MAPTSDFIVDIESSEHELTTNHSSRIEELAEKLSGDLASFSCGKWMSDNNLNNMDSND